MIQYDIWKGISKLPFPETSREGPVKKLGVLLRLIVQSKSLLLPFVKEHKLPLSKLHRTTGK